MLSVGVPKEIKPLEKRVGLTPEAARALRAKKISVLVESGAGELSGFNDAAYRTKGAEILSGAPELWQRAGLIVKVKEPQPAEFSRLRRDQILFSFLHLASPAECEVVRALQQSGGTSIGFETLQKGHAIPILAPMSEIAGGLAAAYAAYFRTFFPRMEEDRRLRKKLEAIANEFPRVPDLPPMGKVVVFGGGVAGQKALEFALALGAEASVVECDAGRRARFEKKNIRALDPQTDLGAVVPEADVLIGCAHARGQRAVQVLSESMLKKGSQKKKILMDVAIDQGGNFPGSRPTTYEQPLYLDSEGNLRFSVANMPSFCGRYASERISHAALPYVEALALEGEEAFEKMPELKQAINIQGGEIKLKMIQEAHQR